MNKHLLLIAILAMTLLASCKDKNAYTITGTATDIPDGTSVYLMMRNKPDWIPIDSAVIKDGKFVMEGQIDPGVLAYLSINDNKMMIVAEPGEITIDINEGRPHGTECNDRLTAFLDEMDPLDQQMEQLYNQFVTLQPEDSAKGSEIMEQMNVLDNQSMTLLVNTIKDNIQNPLGIGLFCMYSSTLADDVDLLVDLSKQIPEQYQQQPYVTAVLRNVEIISQTAVGTHFTDIQFTTVDGKETSIQQLVDSSKYVLIDFWASWCGPCRQSLPGIRDLYDRFSTRGLTVLGISLDDEEQDWRDALEKYRMDWVQTSDLKGWDCQYAAIYGVRAIPATVLIDSTGTIVARNIEASELAEKLESELPR